ncbi:unnamed protein product [Allacma fusca]|uniref:Major facilitator superfamily (MFS) profile domain-containing protein n=2 Tax=Allacma fusca TaxID=39272 RepID=A0A8J2LU90_9HEXA|nr:unnamed protein product [Allacma fusca]
MLSANSVSGNDKSTKKGPQILAALAACMGAFGLGTVLGYSSPAMSQLRDHPDFGAFYENGTLIGEGVSWQPASWIGSLVALGALISGPVIGFCVEAFGRKTTIMALALPFVIGWMLITYAWNLQMIYAGRFVTGFCGGAFSLAAPVYIGETAEDSIRGLLGAGFNLMIAIGILFTYIVGIIAPWDWLAVICACSPMALVSLMMFAPESPRWLISQGKHIEAIESLRWLRGASSSQVVEEEFLAIQRSVDDSKLNSASLKDFTHPSILKPTLICMALMLFQQLSGVNAVIFYTTDIFTDAGSSLAPSMCTVIIGTVQVLASLVSSLLMDKAGRKVLLLFSDLVMSLFLVGLGFFFYLKEFNPEFAAQIGWLPLASLIAFIIAMSVGFGPIPWLMMGELLPPHVKGQASAMATSFNWLLAFLVTFFFEDVKQTVGSYSCYWAFAGICALGTVFVYIFVPETKGKSLDEIQKSFEKGNAKSRVMDA